MKSLFKTAASAAIFAMVLLPLVAAEPASPQSVPAPGKSYQIRNKEFGQLLRPENASNADGAAIVLYPAQAWKCMTWRISSAGDSRYCLQNHFTSKTFAASPGKAETQAVTQVPWGKDADKRPVWQVSPLKDGTFKIVDVKTGNVLTAQKAADGSGATVVLAPWKDGDGQKWELREIDPATLTM